MQQVSKWFSVGVMVAASAGSMVSNSAVTIGGINFQDNAFADTLLSSSGAFKASDAFNAPVITPQKLAEVLTDKDPSTFAFSFDKGAYVQLGFTDNALVNGAGQDLAIFELGFQDSFGVALTLGGTTKTYASTYTGQNLGAYKLNVAKIDLSDFGVAPNASLNGVVIDLSIIGLDDDDESVPSLSLVGAINSVDSNVPDAASTLSLLAVPAFALLTFRRKDARV